MPAITRDEFDVLHGLVVRGICNVEQLGETTGQATENVQKLLDAAVDDGLALHRNRGRVQGYMLTPVGRERHAELRHSAVSPEEVASFTAAYEAFLTPNQEFKTITTRWQTEAGIDQQEVLTDLHETHAQITEVIARAATTAPRVKHYQARLEKALDAFESGDHDALTRPMSGSYHDVWMEFHQDLLSALGKERTESDG